MAGVRFEGLSKTYPSRGGSPPVDVIRQLDLAIDDGEFLVLVGPSGCGKSTLLRLLAGLDTPTAGEIHIGSKAITSLRPAQRDVAMVFQSYALYPHLSVRDNLSFGLRRSGRRSHASAESSNDSSRCATSSAVIAALTYRVRRLWTKRRT